jgi:hypothetical protein
MLRKHVSEVHDGGQTDVVMTAELEPAMSRSSSVVDGVSGTGEDESGDHD